MLHGAGPALRSYIERANTWQRFLIAVALIAVGGTLVALGEVRAGLIGVVGVVLLVGVLRQRFGSRTHPRGAERAGGDAGDPGDPGGAEGAHS